MKYLRPDSKSQVTVEYDDNNNPLRIDTIVISTQHDEFVLPKDKSHKAELAAEKAMQDKIKEDIEKILIPRVKKDSSCKNTETVSQAISNFLLILQENLLLVVLMAIQVLPDVK